MDKLMETALHSMIHKQFELWNERGVVNKFEEELLKGCTDEDTSEKVYARMIINSMEIAAQISAKIILEMLIASEVFQPADEKQIRKGILSVVKADMNQKDDDAGKDAEVKKIFPTK